MPCIFQIPPDELGKVIRTLIELGADVMATYESPDGTTMSIKDRIILRGSNYRNWYERPKLARTILKLCRTTYEEEL